MSKKKTMNSEKMQEKNIPLDQIPLVKENADGKMVLEDNLYTVKPPEYHGGSFSKAKISQKTKAKAKKELSSKKRKSKKSDGKGERWLATIELGKRLDLLLKDELEASAEYSSYIPIDPYFKIMAEQEKEHHNYLEKYKKFYENINKSSEMNTLQKETDANQIHPSFQEQKFYLDIYAKNEQKALDHANIILQSQVAQELIDYFQINTVYGEEEAFSVYDSEPDFAYHKYKIDKEIEAEELNNFIMEEGFISTALTRNLTKVKKIDPRSTDLKRYIIDVDVAGSLSL